MLLNTVTPYSGVDGLCCNFLYIVSDKILDPTFETGIISN